MNAPATAERLQIGGLWRDVLNFVGTGDITPATYLPLLDAILPKWGPWTYFMEHAARKITEDRPEIEADTARAELGWRIWVDHREGLRKFATRSAKRPITDDELENWWVEENRGEWRSWGGAYERGPEFARLTGMSAQDVDVVLHHPEMPNFKHDRWIVEWIRSDLPYVSDLRALRSIARKTWTPNPGDRHLWTEEDLDFVNAFYSEQAPGLVPASLERIDPFELSTYNDEQNLGIPIDGLRYCMLVLMRATVIDFAEEVLERSRLPHSRGSLSCIECGRFVGRRALGYGQLYCTDRCKKRAAKRRYRERLRINTTAAA